MHRRRFHFVAALVVSAAFGFHSACAAADSCGDANGDGNVTVSDGVLVLRAAAGLPSPCAAANCDADGNGTVSISDGVNVLRRAAGLSSVCTAAAIEIFDLREGDDTVRGRVRNVDPTATSVVGWARTDRWYVQPRADAPRTPIAADGSFALMTNPWRQFVALLVDDSYAVPPGPSLDRHPRTDPGVLAYAEVPARSPLRFAGATWDVKASDPFATDPGPCVFAAENATVDSEGRLHLRTAEGADGWTCAEIVHERSLGYGEYLFRLATDVHDLPTPVVFSPFLFESLSREIDIEFSRTLAAPHNAQYVVQPYTTPGNRVLFDAPASAQTSHRILWLPDRIEFASWNGWGPFPPSASDTIAAFTYTGPDVPPAGAERLRINLWLVNGAAPEGGRPVEVVVDSFVHTAP
jgi:hypothetical protein